MKDTATKKRYEKLADEYDKKRFGSLSGRLIDKKQKKVLLKYFEGLKKDSKILEVGCGSGRFLEFLEKKGFKELYGVDQSTSMLKIAGKKSKATLKKGNIYKIPFRDNFFDAVFAIHVIMHLEKPEKAIKEMLRVSKNTVIFDISNKHSISYLTSKISRGYKPRYFSLEEIKKIVSGKKVRFKPTYMFPIKGYFSVIYFAFSLLVEKIAFFLGLGRFASQLFLKIEKSHNNSS